ncbi:DUF6088 family protein [Nocardia salmonicida]|uniref:DUF6088 family protein n=1 Tax=Nocardia salmonicida TaxID=53431 RepID=UPI0007A3BBC5|nr:DUF6088 family protein [Nocardia salmonicida]MBC7299527.1 hypothetical protein [Nocardia sp.]
MRSAVGAAAKALESYPAGSFVHTSRLPGTTAAAASAIKRAHQRGELVPIRRGLYFKGVPTRYGLTRPTAEAVAAEVLGKTGAGPTGFSAARALGLTTQVPAKPTMVVTGAVPTSIPGVEVSKRNNLRRATLRPLEIAVLELLRGDWETTVDEGWTALSAAVGKAVAAGKLRWRALSSAAEGERSPTLRDNLIRLGEDLRVSGMLA